MSARRIISTAEFETFYKLPENVDRRFELIRGEMIEKRTTYLQAYIVARVSGFTGMFLQQNPLGYGLIKAHFRLADDLDLMPDVSVVAHGRRLDWRTDAVPFPPDLAVEAQSDGQSERFMLDKALLYLANGTRMVWIIYSNRQIVEVLTATDRQLLTIDDTLTGGDVLPGFSVAVRDLFPPETE